jgi:hypothetical protein
MVLVCVCGPLYGGKVSNESNLDNHTLNSTEYFVYYNVRGICCLSAGTVSHKFNHQLITYAWYLFYKNS